jgi:hypothetical protein
MTEGLWDRVARRVPGFVGYLFWNTFSFTGSELQKFRGLNASFAKLIHGY